MKMKVKLPHARSVECEAHEDGDVEDEGEGAAPPDQPGAVPQLQVLVHAR